MLTEIIKIHNITSLTLEEEKALYALANFCDGIDCCNHCCLKAVCKHYLQDNYYLRDVLKDIIEEVERNVC